MIRINNYSVTVILYRDCNSFAGFSNITITSYNLVTNAVVKTSDLIEPDEIIQLDFSSTDPCIELPSDICVEKATYTYTVNLPASLDGYLLATQTCCLAGSVQNIQSPINEGINANAIIPPLGGGNPSCFDSPLFNTPPPPYFCLFDILNEDLGAYLPNADPTITLVHSFYTPEYEGMMAPPFDEISFIPPFTETEPMSSVAGLNLDPNTGILTGILDEIGYYYLGVKVYAIKNGDTIATISRPFRYVVSDCNINRSEPELASPIECGNLNVNFDNSSFGADAFFWTFGDSITGLNDTSALSAPSHTYSEFGDYEVRLITIANGDVSCSDTAFLNISIDSAAISTISVNSDYQCLAANNFNFNVSTTESDVTYEWDFGPSASTTSSTLSNPQNISYTQVGVYPIILKTKYQECISETSINVEVFEGLLAEITGPTEGCIPFTATFVPSVIDPTFTYVWRSKGEEMTATNGEFTYFNPGVYSVELYVYDINGCESTDYSPQYISIYEIPETGFTVSKYTLSQGENLFVENTVTEDYKIEFSMETPSKNVNIETNENFTLTMIDTGEFAIVQTVTNNDICISSEEKIINIGPPRVDPPNVFTPNKDGLNDNFFFETYYNRNVELRIFDRWGMRVFSSDNYELCDPESGDNCWDGYDESGKKCIPGVYFYIVSLSNGFNKNGVVSIF